MPKVSIVMPTYNSAKYITETIKSILSQSYFDFELIIVDDCSTDNTSDIIKSFNDPRIKYIILNNNHGGPSKPRNIGILRSSGEYIALFDSDDIMLDEKIKLEIDVLNNSSNVAMVFSDANKITEDGFLRKSKLLDGYVSFRKILVSELNEYSFLLGPEDSYNTLFDENFIPTSSVMVRRETLLDLGLFDEQLTNGDDRDMWFRLTKKNAVAYIDLPLHKYRIRKKSVSNRGVETARNRINVLRKQLKSELPLALEKKIYKLISRNYYGIGYIYRSQNDMRKAREYYLISIKYLFSFRTIKSYLATFLGYEILRLIKDQ